jgi:hypothetical protein
VEYRACSTNTAIERIVLYRIDGDSTCTLILLQQSNACGQLGLMSSGWCLLRAVQSTDVAECLAGESIEGVEATGVTGTFLVDTQGVDLDVELTFPETGGLSTTVVATVSDCAPLCTDADCRD